MSANAVMRREKVDGRIYVCLFATKDIRSGTELRYIIYIPLLGFY